MDDAALTGRAHPSIQCRRRRVHAECMRLSLDTDCEAVRGRVLLSRIRHSSGPTTVSKWASTPAWREIRNSCASVTPRVAAHALRGTHRRPVQVRLCDQTLPHVATIAVVNWLRQRRDSAQIHVKGRLQTRPNPLLIFRLDLTKSSESFSASIVTILTSTAEFPGWI